jgi:uncharacterized membrane protein YbhN (UPF0104 family)
VSATASAAERRPTLRPLLRRIAAWAFAAIALSFVAYVVPLRDRCVDPSAPGGVSLPVTWMEGGGCIVHISEGGRELTPGACAKLSCQPGLASTLSHARPGLVALLALVYLAGTLAWAARWRALLRLADVRISLWRAWRVTLEAQAGGVLLPGGVAGDALRIGAIVGLGAPTATVVATVLLDRVIGLATLAGVAAGLAAAFDASSVGPAVLVLAAIPVAIALAIALLRLDALRRSALLEHRWLARSAKPILTYLGDARAPRAILAALALSALVSVVQLAVVRGLCSAVGAEPTVEHWVYTGTAITFVLGVLPALPGGWGTSDAAFVLFFGRAGLGAGVAVGVSLLYRADWYLSAALGAILYVARRGRGARP